MSLLKSLFQKIEPWKKTLARDLLMVYYMNKARSDKQKELLCKIIIEHLQIDLKGLKKIGEKPDKIPSVYPSEERYKRFYIARLLMVITEGNSVHNDQLKAARAIAQNMGLEPNEVEYFKNFYENTRSCIIE